MEKGCNVGALWRDEELSLSADCIWIIVSKKSAVLKMTAEEKRAGGFLPPEREARRVINNQDEGMGAVEALLLFTEPGHKRKSVIL